MAKPTTPAPVTKIDFTTCKFISGGAFLFAQMGDKLYRHIPAKIYTQGARYVDDGYWIEVESNIKVLAPKET